jgi:hypothetical protein
MPSRTDVTMNASATVRSARYCANARSCACRNTTGVYVSVAKRELMRDTTAATVACSSFASDVCSATWMSTTCAQRGQRERRKEERKGDLVAELGVLLEEELEREQLVLDALDLVELVAPDDELEAGVALLERLDPLLRLRLVSVPRVSRGRPRCERTTHRRSVSAPTSIPIGKTPTSTKCASVWMPRGVASSASTRDTVWRKWRACDAVWKPMRSAARTPRSSFSRTARQRKISELGNATCRKKPTAACGSRARRSSGSSSRW